MKRTPPTGTHVVAFGCYELADFGEPVRRDWLMGVPGCVLGPSASVLRAVVVQLDRGGEVDCAADQLAPAA